MKQLSEADYFRREITERGYGEFTHNIPDEQIEHLIESYAEFTLNHPDPQPETMDVMLPSEPMPADKLSHRLYSHDSAGNKKFMHNLWIAHQLDELDHSKDKQDTWHKYRTNTEGMGKAQWLHEPQLSGARP